MSTYTYTLIYTSLHWKILSANRYARKAYFIAFSLMLLGPLQGMTILTTYVAEIFASTNPNNSPLYASTMITSIMIIAHLIYLNVVDRAGRRKFYICSSLATSAGLTLFAFYLYFLTDNLAFDWVPIVCLSYVLFANSLGMATIPWLIIIETMPKKVWLAVRWMDCQWIFALLILIFYADQTVWLCKCCIVDANQYSNFNWNVSAAEDIHWFVGLGNHFCIDHFSVGSFWVLCFTRNEREIPRGNYGTSVNIWTRSSFSE